MMTRSEVVVLPDYSLRGVLAGAKGLSPRVIVATSDAVELSTLKV